MGWATNTTGPGRQPNVPHAHEICAAQNCFAKTHVDMHSLLRKACAIAISRLRQDSSDMCRTKVAL